MMPHQQQQEKDKQAEKRETNQVKKPGNIDYRDLFSVVFLQDGRDQSQQHPIIIEATMNTPISSSFSSSSSSSTSSTISSSSSLRLYRIAACIFPDYLCSLNMARKAIKEGRLLVNGERVNVMWCLSRGEVIQLRVPKHMLSALTKTHPREEKTAKLLKEAGFRIIHQTRHWAAVLKPAGFQTKGHGRLSLEIGLPLLLLKSNESDFDDAATGIGGVENNTQVGTKNHSRDQNLQKGKDNTNTDIKSENIDDISDKKAMSGRNRIPPAHILPKPLAVHRLDNRVSGVVLIAKTRPELSRLSKEFETRQVYKRYRAIVVGDLRVKHNVQTSSSPLPSLVTNSSILNNEKKMQTLKMMVGRELCEKRRRSKVAIDVPETKTSRKRYIQPEREKKRRKIAQGGDIATEAERKGNENDLTATELHHIYGDSEDAFAIKHNANHEATSTGSTDDGQYDYAAGGQFPPHTNDSKHGSSGGCHAYYCSDKDIDRMYDYTRVGEINTSIDDRDACTLYRVVHHQPCSRYGCLTTVDLFPVTGRTHQLRLHMASLGHPIIGDSLYHQLGYEQQQRQHQQQEQQQELSLYSMNPSSVGATKNGGSNAVDCGDDEDERQRLRKGRGMFLMSCEIRFLVAGIDGRPGKTWAVCRIKEANKFEKLRRKAEKGYRWRLERNHK